MVRRVFGPDEYVEIISTKQSVVSEKARSEFLASRQKYFKIMTGKAEKLRSAEIVCPRCKMSDQTQLIQVLGRMGRVVGQRSSGKR